MYNVRGVFKKFPPFFYIEQSKKKVWKVFEEHFIFIII